MRASLLALFLACATLAAASGPLLALVNQYDGCKNVQWDAYTFFYSIRGSVLHIGLVGRTEGGWMGWGINPNGRMLGADSYTGVAFPNGTVWMSDNFNGAREPCQDITGTGIYSGVCPDALSGGSNSILYFNGSLFNAGGHTYTVLQFGRQLDTGDTYDQAVTNQATDFVHVLGSSQTLSFHDLYFGSTTVNLFAPPACPTRQGVPCSGNGVCVNGCCDCIPGWAFSDCSRNLNQTGLPSTINADDFDFNYQLHPDLMLYWKIDSTAQEITVGLRCKCTGWIGFGFSKDGPMIGSDVVTGYIDNNGNAVAEDRYITDKVAACPGVCLDDASQIGGTQDILDVNGNQNNGVQELLWRRKLNTGDSKGDYVISDSDQSVVFAFHPTSKTLTQHDASTKGQLSINFIKGLVTGTDYNAMRLAHGSLMFIAWAVIIPVTSWIARYLKRYTWWFNVHRWSNGLAMTASVAAFVLATLMATSHFKTAHSIIGLTVVIIGCLQPFIGILADYMFKPDRQRPPLFPDVLHWLLGWSALTLAFINVFLGLDQYGASHQVHIAYVAYATAIFTFLLGYYIFRTIARLENRH